MPVYAATPHFAERHRHPRALALIVGAHVALLAGVMSVKMDLPDKLFPDPTDIVFVPTPPEPSPEPPTPQPQPRSEAMIDRVPVIVPVPRPDQPPIDSTPLPLPDPMLGNTVDPLPNVAVDPPAPVRVGPRFVTPAALVKPPYPESKRRLEQEASLRLRLAIDERGRVTAVAPVGEADAAFLEAARRHILAHWRYRPASEDGRAVPTSTVITLRFELDS